MILAMHKFIKYYHGEYMTKLNPLTSNKNDAESKIDKPTTGVDGTI